MCTTLVLFSIAFDEPKFSDTATVLCRMVVAKVKGMKHIATSPRRHSKYNDNPMANVSVAIDWSIVPIR